jgi:hypothetical protein
MAKMVSRAAPTSPVARRLRAGMTILGTVLAALAIVGTRTADAADTGGEHPTRLVTVARDGYSISGMVSHIEGATKFRHGIALFPGSPGILRLREEGGRVRNDMNGNFLIRSRNAWLDGETMIVAIDAPSDHWINFWHAFRESERYGKDIEALLGEVNRRFPVEEWTFVGTSEGSVSAFHAARMNPEVARRLILTASLFVPTQGGRALSGADFTQIKASLLWVHHADDPCRYTDYASARAFARRSNAPLVTVRGGGPGYGLPCQARTPHGFINMEVPTVQAMHSWVKTGKVPADVGQ